MTTFRHMNNTEIYCLKFMKVRNGATAADVARQKYATSKQPEKKAATMNKHLKDLAKHGFLLRVMDTYFITPMGTDVAKDATQQNRPLMLGLSKSPLI